MFSTELGMYLDHFETLRADAHPENPKQVEAFNRFKTNLAASLSWYREWLAGRAAFAGENLAELAEAVETAEMKIFANSEADGVEAFER
jgi:hypothetical protein